MAAPAKKLHVIGFGAVGYALWKLLAKVQKDSGSLPFYAISFWAPEIKEKSTDGVFEFNPAPFITRDNLVSIIEGMGTKPGDIVLEAATRIDTQTIWKLVKSKGCHFANSGFDVWPDVTLDLEGLDAMQKDEAWSKGTGPTCVFSFGCNPGVASHLVRHALFAATGKEDTKEAEAEFGLASISFYERDTQFPIPGTPGHAMLTSEAGKTQLDVCYNTWSPGNYIVETAESTILYAGCPEASKDISSAGPAVPGWIPSGPNIGFMAPHDETFTIQEWFSKPIPAVFVYEAPPSARAYLKGGRTEHSSVAKKELLCPAKHNLAGPGYDMLGCLLFSSKPGVAPFWCGIKQTVAVSAEIDPSGAVGPTPFQVVGGVWAALQYILEHPNAGDNFPEGLPTPFVVKRAFPWAGELVARPAPEALKVAGLFNPGNVDAAWERISHGEPVSSRITKGAAGGVVSASALPVACALTQLSYTEDVAAQVKALGFAHAESGAANAYVDRNKAIRTSTAVAAGAPITLDHRLLDPATVSTVPAAQLTAVLESVPILHDDAIRTALGLPL